MAAQYFLAATGAEYSGAKAFTYVKDTTTDQSVYTDAALSVPAANPVVADSAGKFEWYFDNTKDYSVSITTDDEATTLFQFDYVAGAINIVWVNDGTFASAAAANAIAGWDADGAVTSRTAAQMRDFLGLATDDNVGFESIVIGPGQATGGGGVAKLIYTGDRFAIQPTDQAGGYQSGKELTFAPDGSNIWAFEGGAKIGGTVHPDATGTVGQVLRLSSAGNLGWYDIPALSINQATDITAVKALTASDVAEGDEVLLRYNTVAADGGTSSLIVLSGDASSNSYTADDGAVIENTAGNLTFVRKEFLQQKLILDAWYPNTNTGIAAMIALASSDPDGYQLWLSRGNSTTADIPDIHDCQLRGPGYVEVAAGSYKKWWAEPTEYNTVFNSAPMRLYINEASGSDSNSGLSSSFPLASLQQAADILDKYRSPLMGFWDIELAADTYTAGATFYGMQNTRENPLYIRGPSVSAWSNSSLPASRAATGGSIPTAIFDGTGDGAGWAIQAQSQSYLVLKDIKFTDWGTKATGDDEGAVRAQDWSYIDADNCHFWDCSKALEGRENSDIVVDGGYVDGCRVGLKAIMARYDTASDAGTGDRTPAPYFNNCTFGVDVWEGGNGHPDWLTLKNCGTGVYVRKGGHAAMRGPTFDCDTGTMVGVKCENRSFYSLDGNEVWEDNTGAGTFIRYRNVDGSPDGREEARSWRTVEIDSSDQATTGTSNLDFLTYSVEADSFVEVGQTFWIRVELEQNLTNSFATLQVRIDGFAVGLTLPSNANVVDGVFEAFIHAKGAAIQTATVDYSAYNENAKGISIGDFARAALTEDMTADRTLTLRVYCDNASDTITITHAEIQRRG